VVEVLFYVDRDIAETPNATISFPVGEDLPLPLPGDIFSQWQREL
jgi:hypothetical protein